MVRGPSAATGPSRATCAALLLAASIGAPGAARGSYISVQSGAIVLGKTQSATVTIGVEEPPGTEDRPLRLSVNVGAFSEPVRIGPGKFKATYVPPPERYPQVALVAVWRETGPDARIDFLRIPLFGTTTVPVKGRPGATVTVATPFQTFGPVTLDAKGAGNVAIEVPPNVREVTATIKEPEGASTRRSIALEVPHYNRLTAALVPYAVTADGKDEVKLHVFYDLDGGAKAPDRVAVEATTGAVAFERTMNGRFLYRYVPPAGATADEVKFAVTIEGDLTARARAQVLLGLPAPAKVVVKPPLVALPPGAKNPGVVSVLVMSAEGLGLPARVQVTANGAPIGEGTAKGGGLYDVAWTPPAEYGSGLVQFRATAVDAKGRSASGAANYQLSAAPIPKTVIATFDPPLVPVGLRSSAVLALDVRDAAGLPLDHASLLAVASDGAVSELSSKGGGRYEARYLAPARSPDGEPVLRVMDAGGSFEQRFPVPIRENPRRLLLGVRGGWATGLDDLSGPRVGVDAWAPFRLGDVWLGGGLSATAAQASREVTGGTTGLTSTSEVSYLPVSLKLGWEVFATRRWSLVLGAAATVAWATGTSSLQTGSTDGWGFGGLGFLGAGFALGPGQIFGEVSYGYVPVSTTAYTLDAGGLAVDLGYRIGIL
jgi:hypothetical protein